jgi:hypothetical protein
VNAICLLVAGALRATLPATEFTLAWTHSVENTRWEERYRVDGHRLRLIEARIQGSGAGMEPPPEATLANGWWTWQPAADSLPELRLTLSSFTRDYDVCWRARCQTLRDLVAPATDAPPGATHARPKSDAPRVVDVRACTAKNAE